ncbi:MAG: hypothetical protein A2X64_10130 [Ignavibacteria bacterium GWF2_33_9]|nr:MAG: hypothetical protein A2X64_10130 [Ignavibacteria bacterium GWF2_33_9]
MLVSTLFVNETLAQPSGKGKMSGKSSTIGSRFVDANSDGICDNNTTGLAGVGMRNQGSSRLNFIDADGDGVCDNNTTGVTGAGMRNQGKTRPNFVDADGDGVCDNFIENPPIIEQ